MVPVTRLQRGLHNAQPNWRNSGRGEFQSMEISFYNCQCYWMQIQKWQDFNNQFKMQMKRKVVTLNVNSRLEVMLGPDVFDLVVQLPADPSFVMSLVVVHCLMKGTMWIHMNLLFILLCQLFYRIFIGCEFLWSPPGSLCISRMVASVGLNCVCVYF